VVKRDLKIIFYQRGMILEKEYEKNKLDVLETYHLYHKKVIHLFITCAYCSLIQIQSDQLLKLQNRIVCVA